MNLKKELLFGVVGVIVLVGIVIYFLSAFNNSKSKVINDNQVKPQPTQTTQTLTQPEVAKHNNPQDCWIIVGKKVYNVTEFLQLHPGGESRIIPFCGKDATEAFRTQGGEGSHSEQAQKQLENYYLGIYE